MATKKPAIYYLPLWEKAEAEEIGLHVTCETADDQRKLVNALYECRKQVGGFEGMMIFQPHPIGTIFIAHQTVEMPD